MIVLISRSAEAELERIADRIALDNPKRSVTFVQELISRCTSLGDMPLAFPILPRYAHLGVRRRVHGNYLIFYRITGKTIEVLHILHGAQNYEDFLFPEI
ncbi:type II toxin-antitoxin system RelE/ParE family toxin [Rhizobium sp. CC-YZS058]|uniref:type II toxin-antitoxin system RelE/ParE family toxin n=1 Tax=Rhizobium sp. CC-YZS058 TaxID=3042153 RepID=UPI002B05D9E5|nr:type II toxin-antitoxin system RelE/ParE family toxin [Rhizobium sp. CC-YZS058]MEA3536305.1 type II toxin-antitoxin system RelE/ParE family toxin [Rhizobium sp. CC-YZS058]